MKSVMLLFVLTLLASQSAFAHSLRTFAYFDNNYVHTETYFSDGKAAKNADVKVFDNTADTLLLTGVTDEKGEFSFQSPTAQSLKIIVRASMGHQSETVLTKKNSHSSEKKHDHEPASSSSSHSHFQSTLTQEQMEKIIDRKLDEKLAPIKSLLEQMIKESFKPSSSEIIAGLGYIVGLFGVAAYFYSQKKR